MSESLTKGDDRRLRVSLWAALALTVLLLSYNMFQEYFLADIESYFQRKFYYETVISKKGLSLHEGVYWREKQ